MKKPKPEIENFFALIFKIPKLSWNKKFDKNCSTALGSDCRKNTPRFKSLIKKSLFILIVYSWSLADKVTWPSIWARVQYIIKTKQISGKETNTELSKSRWPGYPSKRKGKFYPSSFNRFSPLVFSCESNTLTSTSTYI